MCTARPRWMGQDVATVPMRFEVTTLPVADVDRAKAFYQRLGWRLDIDFVPAPASAGCSSPRPLAGSIQFGKDAHSVSLVPWGACSSWSTTSRPPGTSDQPRRRRQRGAPRGQGPSGPRRAGPLVLAERRSATRTATAGCCKRSRPASRPGVRMTIETLADRLHETSGHHGAFEAVAPPHDWWDWYAAYMHARQSGCTPDEASEAAGRYMAEVKGVVVSPA